MSKLTHKSNEKFVGATIGRPHFGETAKKENGITLIALIITIIVMLILTGVTLSITLGDNGLVNKAKEATTQTQIAMDRELLLSAVVGAIGEDGKVNLSSIVLPEGFTGSNGTYTSKNGHTFTVNENGEIIYNGEISGGGDAPSEDEPVGFNWKSVNLDVDTNTEYICAEGPTLNFTEDGKLIISSNGTIMTSVDATNSDNIDGTTGNLVFNMEFEGYPVNGTVTMANETDINTTIVGLQTYTCKKTIIDNETVYSNEDVFKALGVTNSTGTYRGTWTKIGEDENGNSKLVSTSTVSNYTLGYDDPGAIEAVSIVGTEATKEEKLQRSVWSYKNAVNSLNTAAQEATGITTARSIKLEDIYDIIGEENVNKGEEYGKIYNYYYNTETGTVYSKYKTGDNTWSEPYNTNYSSQTFVNDNGETVVIDSAGDEVTLTHSYYTYDFTENQKKEMGILTYDFYWLASPFIECNSEGQLFNAWYMSMGRLTATYDSSVRGSGSRFLRCACRSFSPWSIIKR